MKLDFAVPTPLQYFAALVRRDEPRLLLEAAISLGQDADARLDLEEAQFQFERLLQLLRDCVPWGASALQRLTILNQFFYEDLAYAGDHNNFYDPDNSYLHCVMDKRRGIPISLGVLWLELAHGIGLQASGVSFPGHFMVKVQLPEGIIVQDPLTGLGQSMAQLGERLEPFHERWGLDADEQPPLSMYLQAASWRSILERMLRNLKSIHQQNGNDALALAVMDRLIVLEPKDWHEYRDRGWVHMERGERSAALKDLQIYAKHATQAADLDLIEEQMSQLRGG